MKLLTGSKHCLNLHGTTIIVFFPWIWDELSWKNSALVRSKILGLFVNTLTAEYTYSRRNMQTFTQEVQTPLSLKQKIFSDFLLRFWNLYEMENIFKKKENLLAQVFPKLLTPKEVVCLNAWKALLQNSFR